METSSVSHHQNIQDLNQLWDTDGDCVLGYACCVSVALFLLKKQSVLLFIRPLSKNVRELFNARGLRCQKRGCCCCMTMPDLIQLMREWIFWNNGGGGNSWAPALQPGSGTFGISWKNIFVPSDSNHIMMSSMRFKHGCVVRIPPSIDRVLRNGFPAYTNASTEKVTMWKNKWIEV